MYGIRFVQEKTTTNSVTEQMATTEHQHGYSFVQPHHVLTFLTVRLCETILAFYNATTALDCNLLFYKLFGIIFFTTTTASFYLQFVREGVREAEGKTLPTGHH